MVDMKDQFVYDPLISKRQQYLLATQVCVFWRPERFSFAETLVSSWFVPY